MFKPVLMPLIRLQGNCNRDQVPVNYKAFPAMGRLLFYAVRLDILKPQIIYNLRLVSTIS
jgi:hypothetical protein